MPGVGYYSALKKEPRPFAVMGTSLEGMLGELRCPRNTDNALPCAYELSKESNS